MNATTHRCARPRLSRAARVDAGNQAFAANQQSPRYPAAELRRRLGVAWDRLRRFGVTRPTMETDREARYPLRLVRLALEAPPPPPLPAETVTAWVVRNPDGSLLGRHFEERSALITALVANSSVLHRGEGLYTVEPVTVDVRATGKAAGP